MTGRRYQSATFVSPHAAQPSIVETPRYGMPPEREPINVAATIVEIVFLAMAWAGVILAGGLAWDAWARWPLDRWPLVTYVAGITFLAVAAIWATGHVQLERWQRSHDRRAWQDIERDLAECDEERRNAIADNERLRTDLQQARIVVNKLRNAGTRYTDAPSPAAPAPEDKFADAVRAIVTAWELGNSTRRDDMVAAGKVTPGAWGAAMRAIAEAGFAKQGGKGNGWIIVARRAQDVLDAVLQ